MRSVMSTAAHTDGRSHDRLVVAVSYADDAAEFAGRLITSLDHTAAPVETWPSGETANKIRAADVLMLLISRGLGGDGHPCREEVDRAEETGVDTVGVRVHDDAPVPDWAARLEVVDPAGVDHWLREARSYERRMTQLTARLERLTELAEGTAGHEQRRFLEAAHDCVWRIAELEVVRSDPDGVRLRRAVAVEARMAADRQPVEPPPRSESLIVINEPPAVPQAEFRDREDHLRGLVRLLASGEKPLLAITGPRGVGKTGMVSRLLGAIRTGEVELPLVGFVYLPVYGMQPVNASLLVHALAEVARSPLARRSVPWRDLLDGVLDALAGQLVILVIDNAENLIDQHGRFSDRELDGVLKRLVERRDHGVRPVLVLQADGSGDAVVPVDAHSLPLSEGLKHPYAAQFLRVLDAKELIDPATSDAELATLVESVGGSPRGLELAYRLITGPDGRSVTELRRLIAAEAPTDVVDFLFGQAFDELDMKDKRIVQALAIYRRPVPAAAVDYLLMPNFNAPGCEDRLGVLCRQRLVRRHGADHFYLPPDDRQLVAMTIKPGERQDSEERFTRIAMYRRGAGYFAKSKILDDRITGVDHLTAHFAEIDLTLAAGDTEQAQDLITEVDARHLHRLGHSISLVPFIERLGTMTIPWREFRRLCTLIWAYRQEKDHDQVVDLTARAIELARRQGRRRAHATLLIQLGNSYLDHGAWPAAASRYRDALRLLALAPRWKDRIERAAAHVGLAHCHLSGGRFDETMRQQEKAARALRRERSGDLAARNERTQLRVVCESVTGLVHLYRNESGPAIECFDRALALAEGMPLDRGRCHLQKAQLFLNLRQFSAAVDAAEEAAEIGLDTGAQALSRDAKEILALACLLTGEFAQAESAVKYAVKRRPSAHGLLIQGIVEYQRGDLGMAADAFDRAGRLIETMRAASGPDFQLLNIEAMAKAGQGLCEQKPEWIGVACDLYRRARVMTAHAEGPRKRNEILLGLWESSTEPEFLERLIAAAVGSIR
jgi:tetratricopeptide (TPR) repeat protein